MTTPKQAGERPMKLQLAPGDYSWCACGESKDQPFCDGSHRGGEFTPVRFTAPAADHVFLCLCKRTQSPPYCDGSHKQTG